MKFWYNDTGRERMMSVPRFSNRDTSTGKKRSDQIGVVTGSVLKGQLEILAKHNKRTLSDFCKIELEKVIEQKENQEILKKYKESEDNNS